MTCITIMIDEKNEYQSCELSYTIGSSDDKDLEKPVVATATLAGKDLTDAKALIESCKTVIKSDENIT